MDWERVIEQLDLEWDMRRRRADQLPNGVERERMMLIADIAFMLRDVLQAGLNSTTTKGISRG